MRITVMSPGIVFPPQVLDPALVGTYPALTGSGAGYVWDAVLEYRVWCHPEGCGDDYYCAFSTYGEALAFAEETRGAEQPLALVLQEEYINEPSPGQYIHVRERRITEWPVEFLARARRTPQTIPDFLASNAPNRRDTLRGPRRD
jgi:hypothetical protein